MAALRLLACGLLISGCSGTSLSASPTTTPSNSGSANVYTTLTATLAVPIAGLAITLSVAFDTSEPFLSGGNFSDDGYAEVIQLTNAWDTDAQGVVHTLFAATAYSTINQQVPFRQITYTFPAAGAYRLEFGVRNVGDDLNPSAIAVQGVLSCATVVSGTPTPSNTPSNSPTRTRTKTSTPTKTMTPTQSGTPTPTTTQTPSPSRTGTPSASGSGTHTATMTPTSTQTPSRTSTPSHTPSPSATHSGICHFENFDGGAALPAGWVASPPSAFSSVTSIAAPFGGGPPILPYSGSRFAYLRAGAPGVPVNLTVAFNVSGVVNSMFLQYRLDTAEGCVPGGLHVDAGAGVSLALASPSDSVGVPSPIFASSTCSLDGSLSTWASASFNFAESGPHMLKFSVVNQADAAPVTALAIDNIQLCGVLVSPTVTYTGTMTPSLTGTMTGTMTGTSSHTGTPSGSRSGTPSGSRTGTPSGSRTGTPSGSRTGTPSSSHTGTPSPSHTGTPSPSQTPSPAMTPSPTPSFLCSFAHFASAALPVGWTASPPSLVALVRNVTAPLGGGVPIYPPPGAPAEYFAMLSGSPSSASTSLQTTISVPVAGLMLSMYVRFDTSLSCGSGATAWNTDAFVASVALTAPSTVAGNATVLYATNPCAVDGSLSGWRRVTFAFAEPGPHELQWGLRNIAPSTQLSALAVAHIDVCGSIVTPTQTPSPSDTPPVTGTTKVTPTNSPTPPNTPSSTRTRTRSPTSTRTRSQTASSSKTPPNTRSRSHSSARTPSHTALSTRVHGVRNNCGYGGKCFNTSPSKTRKPKK